MAQRGHNRAKPQALKEAAGTDRRDRQVVPLFPGEPGAAYVEPVMPKGMSKRAREVWRIKVDQYASRGQVVAGCEAALEQYCELEAELRDLRRRQITPPVAMINAHRIYANEFYDTPASQHAPLRQPAGTANPFSRNGKPGEGASGGGG